MEPSVLERQRAMLQPIYHSQHDHHFYYQCNSSLTNNTNKRKAEIDIEGEGEEKSEITTTKTEGESCGNMEIEKPDYIHVRARRGQATDSHSLAERARREKISKKMKCLQDLVPGCDKVTGKAGMLDEIINYVQSLQKQVQFLSMKLSTVNPRLDVGIDNIFSKEIEAYITQLEESHSSCFQYNEMQNCGAHQVAIDEAQIILQKSASFSNNNSLPIPEEFQDSSSICQLQQLSGWDSDWQQTLFSTGFH